MTAAGYRPLEVAAEVRAYQKRRFAETREQAFTGERPYVLTSPLFPHEIFDALDLNVVVDAWYSGLVAAKRQAGYYAGVFEEHGFHRGLSHYLSMPYAVSLDAGRAEAPWGGLPQPGLIAAAGGADYACAYARTYGIPEMTLHMPSLTRPYPRWWEMSRWRAEDLDGPERIDMLAAQLRDVVAAAENLAGRPLDTDRLRRIVDRVNRQEEYFDRVRDLICHAPRLPVRLGDINTQVMGIQWHRGSEWALIQAGRLYEDVRGRVERSEWVCPHEGIRLMWLGTGLWQNQRFLDRFEQKYGAVFARSNYLSIASDGYLRYGYDDPIRALASRYVTMSEQMHMPGLGSAWALHEARRHRIDGAVLVGEWWWGSQLIAHDLERAGIPVMTLEAGSIGDGRWDDDRLYRSVAEFIETRLLGDEGREVQ